MKKLFLILTLLITYLFPRSDALIVGVGEYKNNIPSLWGVEKDIKNIKKLFRYLGIKHIQTLTDKQATLRNIRKTFNNYINSPQNNSKNSFIFYYSGHGVQVHDIDGDEPDGKDEAFGLYELELHPTKNIIQKGLLLDDELYTLLGRIKSKKILIFDKCHADSSHRGGAVKSLPIVYTLSQKFWETINPKINAENSLTNFVLFSATRADEEAEDSIDGGLFTNSIIDGILNRKADLDDNGIITVNELENFCKGNISKLAININNKGYGGGLKGNFTPRFSPVEILNHSIESIFNIQKNTSKPQQIIVTETQPIYQRETFIPKEILKIRPFQNKTQYRENERIRFKLKSSMGGYLNVFILRPNGYTLFMKNRKIRANHLYYFPNSFFKHKHLIAKKPYGITKIYTLLSRKPLDIDSYLSNNSLNRVGENLNSHKGVMITYKNKITKERFDVLGIGGIEVEVY